MLLKDTYFPYERCWWGSYYVQDGCFLQATVSECQDSSVFLFFFFLFIYIFSRISNYTNYIQRFTQIRAKSNTESIFMNSTLPSPSLNITSFIVEPNTEILNETAQSNRDLATYSNSNETYKLSYIIEYGSCQPDQDYKGDLVRVVSI